MFTYIELYCWLTSYSTKLAQQHHTLMFPKYKLPTPSPPLSSSTIYYIHHCDLLDLIMWVLCLRSLSGHAQVIGYSPYFLAWQSRLPWSHHACLSCLISWDSFPAHPHMHSVLQSYAVSLWVFKHIQCSFITCRACLSFCLEQLLFSCTLAWKMLTSSRPN